MRLPVFTSLRGYRGGWLRSDAIARLTVWAVLVPEALAYASIAGVRDVIAAVSGSDGTPEYRHRTVHDAVDAAVRVAQRHQTEVGSGDEPTPGRRRG